VTEANMDNPENDLEPSQQLLTKAQVARYVQCTPRCIDNWMRLGYLPYLKIGRVVRFKAADVDAYLEEHFRVIRRQRTPRTPHLACSNRSHDLAAKSGEQG
jgi:excisionase family DNA binding protein